MKSIKNRARSPILYLLALMVFFLPCQAASATEEQLNLPRPLGYVSDYAEILDDVWQARIRSACKELEDRTGIEMIVVTLPTVSPLANAQEYGAKLYEGWRIGTAQQERGILVLTAMEEQQAVVVLGPNLLSGITRSRLDDLRDRHFMSMFQVGDYGEHLYQATVLLASDAGQMPAPSGGKKKSSAGFWMNLSAVVVMLIALWRFTRPERSHPFQRWRRGEYWGTGQGGFGGNFGGFGGGMSGRGLG